MQLQTLDAALREAARQGDLRQIRSLLDQGADPYDHDLETHDSFVPAITIAVTRMDVDAICTMLDHTLSTFLDTADPNPIRFHIEVYEGTGFYDAHNMLRESLVRAEGDPPGPEIFARPFTLNVHIIDEIITRILNAIATHTNPAVRRNLAAMAPALDPNDWPTVSSTYGVEILDRIVSMQPDVIIDSRIAGVSMTYAKWFSKYLKSRSRPGEPGRKLTEHAIEKATRDANVELVRFLISEGFPISAFSIDQACYDGRSPEALEMFVHAGAQTWDTHIYALAETTPREVLWKAFSRQPPRIQAKSFLSLSAFYPREFPDAAKYLVDQGYTPDEPTIIHLREFAGDSLTVSAKVIKYLALMTTRARRDALKPEMRARFVDYTTRYAKEILRYLPMAKIRRELPGLKVAVGASPMLLTGDIFREVLRGLAGTFARFLTEEDFGTVLNDVLAGDANGPNPIETE